ncbi:hypothetical protein LTR10_024350 [Elasticomyces elasticus]|uniref:Uncharacterized protein n=1 Tax=Exophiala sideris TaxID=1016849 RepID=A0ABR0IU32_9EURO|nr:hypothetical protein LTR10_024350 [Elasticomyces elasticus]KAK5020740.1 hypothetical protein LTS07_011461 [Exophiala sideris]KAK5022864.1 hypothetical protein LTR13_011388 [Exophiala sideris]KAK5048106.1 hypothetical protein LTR69_011462 [Exophiala sideris]KAK5175989.1 hypothetical protein LTR44_011454 [Eurotiomycetes sp. CCFEE 6388]
MTDGSSSCRVPPVTLALVAFLFFVDFVEVSTNSFGLKFLNKQGTACIIARPEKDRHDAIPRPFRLGGNLKNALDLKVCGFAAPFGLVTPPSMSSPTFFPINFNSGIGFDVAAFETRGQ